MPARRAAGGGGGGGSGVGRSLRRKHSLGNLRRAHPASGATWNVQVVRGKMSSKCLWHACRALVLGITLLLLGVGMATVGYFADNSTMDSELRGNATVRLKNDLKGFHLNNLSYVGPIVMGFGGFIVVASCVMTFEARDSAAKVVPARLRVSGNGKTTGHSSNQGSGASQRKTAGMQLPTGRWDHNFGVFRSSPAAETQQVGVTPFDREALTAELIKFSKSLSATARFSPQLRRLTLTGSVPNISTCSLHPLAYSTKLSNLLSPHHKSLLLMEQKRHSRHLHHYHHYYHHNYHQHQHPHQHQQYCHLTTTINSITSNNNKTSNNSGRQLKGPSGSSGPSGPSGRISTSLIQRQTRKSTSSVACGLLQPPYGPNKLYWHAASFDDTARLDKQLQRLAERTKRSNTAKRHILARQRPIEQHEEESPVDKRRNSTMSDSSYSGRWAMRASSIASRASSIDSRRIQVDLHSPEVLPKSILRSPKRYNSGPSATSSIEKEFRSQLSVCSEPPNAIRQLSGQSSLEPCLPEEIIEIVNPKEPQEPKKVTRPDTLPLNAAIKSHSILQRSHSSRTYYDRKNAGNGASILNQMPSSHRLNNEYECFDSEQVINERRRTLLKANSETALIERKLSGNFSIPERIIETSQHTSIDMDSTAETSNENDIILQIDSMNTGSLVDPPGTFRDAI